MTICVLQERLKKVGQVHSSSAADKLAAVTGAVRDTAYRIKERSEKLSFGAFDVYLYLYR
jgi:hypothetical protein